MERRIVVEGREILYELTAKKVKNLNLRVRPDGRVAVSVPRRLSTEAADRFVLSRGPWLLRALDRAAARRDALPEAALPRLWGEPLDIVRRPGFPAGAALAEGRLLLTLEDPAQEPALLRRWQSEQAAAQFPARLAALYPLAAAEGVACPQLRVRRMTSRWGSCAAATGWVPLNTALLSLPSVCLDYVILHELAHCLHPDHSPAFYAVLDRWMPGHREVRRRMRDFQPRALLLGESIVP